MRAKFNLIAVLLLAISGACFAGEPINVNVILHASSESQIKRWAADQGTSSRVLKFSGDGKDVIVLLEDIASGITRENIYVFYLERNEWYLCLLRVTDGHVDVENSGTALVFKNSKGSVLVEQPFASMRYFEEKE